MKESRASLAYILAITNWLSLIILIWLIVLGLVILGWFQVFALIFFFLVAFVTTMYDPDSVRVAGKR